MVLDDSSSRRTLMLVHAHPDDETLTTGGTIARYAEAGVRVVVVTCTLGEEGEIIPSALAQLGSWAADQLGGYRAGELREACTALGPVEHRYLGGIGRWRDSGMAGTPSAEHPRAFVGGPVEEQTEQLRTLIGEIRPDVVVSYDSFGGYGHPDHIRAHEITMAAAVRAEGVRRVFATVMPRSAAEKSLAVLRAAADVPFTVPDDFPMVADERVRTSVDVSRQVGAKFAALEAHATQVSVWRGPTPCFALSNGLALPNTDAEHFELVSGPDAGADTDLFGGLR